MFDLDDFVQDLDLETQVFMSGFSETQSFHEFIRSMHQNQDELDYERLFLNQSIQAKVNRSKFVFNKFPTRFLDEESFEPKTIIHLSDPPMNHSTLELEVTRKGNVLMNSWDLQLFSTFTKSLLNSNSISISISIHKSNLNTTQWLTIRFKNMSMQSNSLIEQKVNLIQQQLKDVAAAIYHYATQYLSIQTFSSIHEAISILKKQHAILKDILLEQSDSLQE